VDHDCCCLALQFGLMPLHLNASKPLISCLGLFYGNTNIRDSWCLVLMLAG